MTRSSKDIQTEANTVMQEFGGVSYNFRRQARQYEAALDALDAELGAAVAAEKAASDPAAQKEALDAMVRAHVQEAMKSAQEQMRTAFGEQTPIPIVFGIPAAPGADRVTQAVNGAGAPIVIDDGLPLTNLVNAPPPVRS